LRERPDARPVGYQRWNQLLFAHWPVDPDVVQATLPRGLTVDTFAGAAYVGIVPFAMARVRPAYLPPLPGLSWFLELNVRTYVFDSAGRPGVWFYSLDCNQALAVAIARRLFHLPYYRARMSVCSRDGTVAYDCRRRADSAPQARFAWTPGADATSAVAGTLEFFLIERYLLYAADPAGRLYTGRVHHAPYVLSSAKLSVFSTEPARQAGLHLKGDPTSVLAAPSVNVSIFPLMPLHQTQP
jgi:uncharacterized protein YqjF (DUF2071 family)